eukprot:g17044.t1
MESSARQGGNTHSLRFICAGHGASALRIAFHAAKGLHFLHAGHVARWADSETEQKVAEARAEPYAMASLTGSSSAVPFDATAEFLLGGACGSQVGEDTTGVFADRGPDVAHFLATLRLPVLEERHQEELGRTGGPGAIGSSKGRGSPPRAVDAASHPSKSIFAAGSEDGTVQLWSFGGRLLRQLPRPSVSRHKKPGEEAEEVSAAGRWQLAWSATGNRLLGVQTAQGKTSVNLWALTIPPRIDVNSKSREAGEDAMRFHGESHSPGSTAASEESPSLGLSLASNRPRKFSDLRESDFEGRDWAFTNRPIMVQSLRRLQCLTLKQAG